MRELIAGAALSAAAFGLGGCNTPADQAVAAGAVFGGASGAVFGSMVTAGQPAGAFVGGAIGAASGAMMASAANANAAAAPGPYAVQAPAPAPQVYGQQGYGQPQVYGQQVYGQPQVYAQQAPVHAPPVQPAYESPPRGDYDVAEGYPPPVRGDDYGYRAPGPGGYGAPPPNDYRWAERADPPGARYGAPRYGGPPRRCAYDYDGNRVCGY
jgi:hypothetical protein